MRFSGVYDIVEGMLSRSTLLHLRIPFSYFLLPVYLFALSAATEPVFWRAALVFVILHLLLYPASNSFNSYYDRDTGSIGGLKHPPPVERELLPVSLALDALALALSLVVGWAFALAVLVYGLCSKTYSWDKTRLKRFPLWGVFGASLVSGALGFFMTYVGVQIGPGASVLEAKPLWGAAVSACLLLASFPLTQVYQHEEDRRRGDRTLSLVLGVRGTFLFSGVALSLSLAALFAYCVYYYGPVAAAAFAGCAAIPAAFFLSWLAQALRDPGSADYDRAMRQSLLSATALNVFFAGLAALEHIFHVMA